jgi:hypothetical protein
MTNKIYKCQVDNTENSRLKYCLAMLADNTLLQCQHRNTITWKKFTSAKQSHFKCYTPQTKPYENISLVRLQKNTEPTWHQQPCMHKY